MVEIIPAVLPMTFEELRAKLGRLKGLARTVQIDLCDGFFVPTRTWPYATGDRAGFEDIVRGKSGLPFWEDFNFEIDLMVQKPERVLPDWVRAGIIRAVFHLESPHDLSELLRVRGDIELGVAINIATPLARLDPYIEHVDHVQFMGIESIGKQGEPFDDTVIEKIREFKAAYPTMAVQVDGGVDRDTAPPLIVAGVDRLVVGHDILNAADPKAEIEVLSML